MLRTWIVRVSPPLVDARGLLGTGYDRNHCELRLVVSLSTCMTPVRREFVASGK